MSWGPHLLVKNTCLQVHALKPQVLCIRNIFRQRVDTDISSEVFPALVTSCVSAVKDVTFSTISTAD